MRPSRVLIIGSGFAGLHCARELERRTSRAEAELMLASPVDFMLYSPLLPQVAAGILSPRAVAVSLRRALRRTRRLPCAIVGVDLERRVCVARSIAGVLHVVPWDRLVLCPGAVTRTFEIPGLTEHGRGLKTLAEAVALRDHVIASLELANATSDERERAASCCFIVVGAGYAGTETAAALNRVVRAVLPRFPYVRGDEVRCLLVDVAPRILPELGELLGTVALGVLRGRGVEVLLGTSVEEVTRDAVRLSTGTTVPCRTLVWTAGVTANPLVATLGLETNRGRLVVTPELTVPDHSDVFALGDAAAVPDLATGPDAICPPTAQHAQRQGRAAARNVAASLRGTPMRRYRQRNLGLVVDLAGSDAVARPVDHDLVGLPAQAVTRGYHLLRVAVADRAGSRVRRLVVPCIDRRRDGPVRISPAARAHRGSSARRLPLSGRHRPAGRHGYHYGPAATVDVTVHPHRRVEERHHDDHTGARRTSG